MPPAPISPPSFARRPAPAPLPSAFPTHRLARTRGYQTNLVPFPDTSVCSIPSIHHHLTVQMDALALDLRKLNIHHIDKVLDVPLHIGALLRVRFFQSGIRR